MRSGSRHAQPACPALRQHCVGGPDNSLRAGYGIAAVSGGRQHALIEQPDPDQHGAEPDEGQRPQHALQFRHVEKEDLGNGDHHEANGGDAQNMGTEPQPSGKQDNPIASQSAE